MTTPVIPARWPPGTPIVHPASTHRCRAGLAAAPGPPIGCPMPSTTSVRQWSPSSISGVFGSSAAPTSRASPNRQLENPTTLRARRRVEDPVPTGTATWQRSRRACESAPTSPSAQLPSPLYPPARPGRCTGDRTSSPAGIGQAVVDAAGTWRIAAHDVIRPRPRARAPAGASSASAAVSRPTRTAIPIPAIDPFPATCRRSRLPRTPLRTPDAPRRRW